MIRLEPARVRWIFIHTAAYSGDAGADVIDRWHRDRGWDGIGYHWVIRRDGELERGRSDEYVGAHVQGANSRSIGICCEGHADHEPHTPPQRKTLLALCHSLMKRYNVPAEGVLGHREVNQLIDEDLVGDQYRTGKTCPGEFVDMEEIRAALSVPHALPEPQVAEMLDFADVSREHEPRRVE